MFPKLLSYINAKDAKLWRGLDVNQDRGGAFTATVSSFWAAPKHGKKAWFGCALFPPTKRVGVSDQRRYLQSMWHAIAFGIITREDGGKALLLYDTDVKKFVREPERMAKALTHGALRQLTATIRRDSRSLEVWVNKNRPLKRQSNKCAAIACQNLAEWISYGDELFAGKGDPRVEGEYHCISKP